MKDTMIGVDLAKNVFQLHAASIAGHMKFRKKLSRGQFFRFMSEQAPALVVMESCGSAHYWARELVKMGHEVKLIAPQYVRPFVKRQKNDAADAEAIVIAARQPEMRFVPPKTADQQAPGGSVPGARTYRPPANGTRERPGSTKRPRSSRNCPSRAMSPAGFRRCRVWGR